MRKSPTIKKRNCTVCGKEYQPAGPTAKYCSDCRETMKIKTKERWYKKNNPDAYKPAKKDVINCDVCGDAFASSYNGINCCQKHYNLAYRTGNPYSKPGRKSTNTFIDKDYYMIGVTKSGVQYLFDKDAYDIVSKYSWCLSKTGYLVANINHKVIKLHRYILDAPDGTILDHINRNPLDNRKSNLRFVDTLANTRNISVSKSSKTGFLGVSKTKSKYRARISVDGKEVNLGHFDNIEDAVEARKQGELKYFGEHAPSLS